MMPDLITVGITAYNAAATIERAARSALAQDWANKEIVIVDDASTDTTQEIIARLAALHPSIRAFRNAENLGPAGTRNRILQEARGAFIAFFDDDDESLPSRLSTQHRRITDYERHGAQLIACYASGTRLYPNGYKIKLNAIGSREKIPQGSAVADHALFFGRQPGLFYGTGTPSCALMARREIFAQIGGFDPAFRRVEDIDFAIRLALAGGHFIGCPENLFLQHATEGGDKSADKNLEAELQLAEKHAPYLRSVGRYEYAKRWPKIRYHHYRRDYVSFARELAALALRSPGKTLSQLLTTGPRRLLHEARIKRKTRP